MECYYINLDTAKHRKENIEKNFQKYGAANWSLTRFAAKNIEYIGNNMIPGHLRPNEKACFLSHKSLIEKNINALKPILILEDDAILGKNTCVAINNVMKIQDTFDWDILFTDVCIPEPSTMIELIKLRKQLLTNNNFQILNLTSFNFAGATAYIINPKSAKKIFDLLNINKFLNIPYDLYLRQLIYEKKLNGYVIFPFATSLSNESEFSQIQLDRTLSTDLVWNTFRKLIWLDRDMNDLVPLIKKIEHDVCDEESKIYGAILAASISNKFIPK